MNFVLILPPIWAWILLELILGIRDVVRRKGRPDKDRGTRVIVTITTFVAYAGAILASSLLEDEAGWTMGSWHLVTGEIVAWAGLALRLWAIVVLGASFRLTVEVDDDQPIIDRGPYRFVRHPSYTGLLLIGIGFGLALGNWLSLLILIVIPMLGILRRIGVEETQLIEVLGGPYVEYRKRTKRLVPGVW
jgi:protein-S-isoprenylcysteine O-methyltransferase Ste14